MQICLEWDLEILIRVSIFTEIDRKFNMIILNKDRGCIWIFPPIFNKVHFVNEGSEGTLIVLHNKVLI